MRQNKQANKFKNLQRQFYKHFRAELSELSNDTQQILMDYFRRTTDYLQRSQFNIIARITEKTHPFEKIIEINDFLQEHVKKTEFINLHGLQENTDEVKNIVMSGEEKGTFILEGMKTDESKYSIELWKEIEKIELRNKSLQYVDLSPLKQCTNLEYLILSMNEIESIDLSPIHKCVALRTLFLEENKIRNIDLTPLEPCENFSGLSLSSNMLKVLNLAPLEKSKNIRSISLASNRLNELDLSPLHNAKNLEYLTLQSNNIQELDLTPLSGCDKLESLNVSGNKSLELDLTPLKHCKSLETINLEEIYSFKVLDLTPLGQCPKLKLVYLTLPKMTGGPFYTAQESAASVLREVVRPLGPYGVIKSIKWIRKRRPEIYKQKTIPTVNYRESSVIVSPCPVCDKAHRIRLKIVYEVTSSERESIEKVTRTFKCPEWNESFDFTFKIKSRPNSRVHLVESY